MGDAQASGGSGGMGEEGAVLAHLHGDVQLHGRGRALAEALHSHVAILKCEARGREGRSGAARTVRGAQRRGGADARQEGVLYRAHAHEWRQGVGLGCGRLEGALNHALRERGQRLCSTCAERRRGASGHQEGGKDERAAHGARAKGAPRGGGMGGRPTPGCLQAFGLFFLDRIGLHRVLGVRAGAGSILRSALRVGGGSCVLGV